MLKIKKILVLGIAAILTLGIAGCTKSSNQPAVHTHTFVTEEGHAATCTATGKTNGLKCSDCGEVVLQQQDIAKTAHAYTLTSVTLATLKADGVTKYTCSICNDEKTEVLPQLKYQRIDKDGTPNIKGEYVYFGFYPQTYVSDKSITAKLDKLTVDATTNYINYGTEQYAKVKAKPYKTDYKFSDGTPVVADTDYYFKVEPIKWRILNPTATDGTAMLLSESILINKAYQLGKDEQNYNTSVGVPENTFVNNYEHSEIRSWLIGEFYNKTFTGAQKEIIKETIVDNSATSTGDGTNPYACANTNDKVFLLSDAEVINSAYGFTSDIDRVKYGTDYAKAQGLNVYQSENKSSAWWLRSPDNYHSDLSRLVRDNGIHNGTLSVTHTDIGVAPALNIKLQ